MLLTRRMALVMFTFFLAISSAPLSYSQSIYTKDAESGIFDMGKMWTFEYPPKEHFQQTYGFTADDQWFDEVRLSTLRFASYCTASFVSANGLVMTNHHCARESGTEVQQKGEDLSSNGFMLLLKRKSAKCKDCM